MASLAIATGDVFPWDRLRTSVERSAPLQLAPTGEQSRRGQTAKDRTGPLKHVISDIEICSKKSDSHPREGTMLVLSRKCSESIRINDDAMVTVLAIQGNKVRLGIEAPTTTPVHRDVIHQARRNALYSLALQTAEATA